SAIDDVPYGKYEINNVVYMGPNVYNSLDQGTRSNVLRWYNQLVNRNLLQSSRASFLIDLIEKGDLTFSKNMLEMTVRQIMSTSSEDDPTLVEYLIKRGS